MKQGLEIAKILVDKGFDAIEPSGGIGETQIGTKNAYPSRQIKSPEEFVEDLCDRGNTVYSSAMDEDDKMNQLAYLIGFITVLKA